MTHSYNTLTYTATFCCQQLSHVRLFWSQLQELIILPYYNSLSSDLSLKISSKSRKNFTLCSFDEWQSTFFFRNSVYNFGFGFCSTISFKGNFIDLILYKIFYHWELEKILFPKRGPSFLYLVDFPREPKITRTSSTSLINHDHLTINPLSSTRSETPYEEAHPVPFGFRPIDIQEKQWSWN